MKKKKGSALVISALVSALLFCLFIIFNAPKEISSILSSDSSNTEMIVYVIAYMISLILFVHFSISLLLGTLLAISIITESSKIHTIQELTEYTWNALHGARSESKPVYYFIFLSMAIMYLISFIIISIHGHK